MSVGAVSTRVLPTAGLVVQGEEVEASTIVQMPPVAVQAVPRYHHAAGSCEVPVYGASVAVPILYQPSSARLPTTTYSEDSGLSHEQMKAIFPLGAPEAFQPFQPSRCIYNIVESAEHCLPENAADSSSLTAAEPVAKADTPTLELENATGIEAGATDEPLHDDGQKRLIKKKAKRCC
mmetsp:Transcript_89847/g.178607  ORF Transcript_89847/g.178607 Transcript_89847/m.178607 type:complete len:178 (-) Transcript_89847:149-682(-)